MIRVFKESDREGAEQCLVELYNTEKSLEENRMDGEEIASPYLTQILHEAKVKSGTVLVAEVDKKIVGFICAWVEDDRDNLVVKNKIYGFISDLVVLKDYQHHHLGSALLKATEDYFRKKGLLNIRMQCLASNKDAKDFYKEEEFKDYEVLLTKKL